MVEFHGENAAHSAVPLRVEHDSMGEIGVPSNHWWGAQTQRAVENFPISHERVSPALLRALAGLKAEAALVNGELGVISFTVAEAIAQVAEEVISGEHAKEFPVDLFQTGSGTSTNMNMNEVLANLASARGARREGGGAIRANDEVNASQSSNDLFPSAIHLAALEGVVSDLIPGVEHLADALSERAAAFVEIVKAGRTHLMDATPVTLGQEFGGYAAAMHYGAERLRATLERVGELPLGGTAVGTGINAPPLFATKVIARLIDRTGLPLREARNHFEAQGSRDALVELSGAIRTVALSLYKIANDLRWMASGSTSGLGEIHLPDLQPGSSIMPGKVNPVIPEAVCQVVAQVVGNDAAVAFAGAAGNFELNVMLPVIARNLLSSITLLSSVTRLFADRCIAGVEVDEARCRHYARSTSALATALAPAVGYEQAGEVIALARERGIDLIDAVVALGLLSREEAERTLDPLAMTRGGIIGS